MLRNHHYLQNFFIILYGNSVPIKTIPLATTSSLTLVSTYSMFHFFEFDYSGSHISEMLTIFVLIFPFCLAYFIEHNVFRIHSWYGMYQKFIPFRLVHVCINFVYPFIYQWTCELFPSFGYVSNHWCTTICSSLYFQLLWIYTQRIGIMLDQVVILR